MIWFLRLFPSFRRLMARVDALEDANAVRNAGGLFAGFHADQSRSIPLPAPSRNHRLQKAMAEQAQYAARIQQTMEDPTGWGTH